MRGIGSERAGYASETGGRNPYKFYPALKELNIAMGQHLKRIL